MYREMGIEPSAYAVADHYRGLISGFVIDNADYIQMPSIKGPEKNGPQVMVTDIWMNTREDRVRLADEIVSFGEKLVREGI